MTGLSTIGIIAGGGSLPRQLADHCAAQGTKPFIVGFADQTDEDLLASYDSLTTRLDKAGAIVKVLKEKNIHDLVLIGSIKRPHLTQLRPDLFTAGFFAKLGLRALGDSDLLSAIRGVLEKEGFIIHAVQNFMSDLLFPHGVLGKHSPTKPQMIDVDLGKKVAQTLGALDVGQSVIVQDGIVLGVEGVEGTNALIDRCAAYRVHGKGGVLIKLVKPQQDRALDLPTIGLKTIEKLSALKFDGLAASAGESLLADRDACVAAADKAGLFLMGVK